MHDDATKASRCATSLARLVRAETRLRLLLSGPNLNVRQPQRDLKETYVNLVSTLTSAGIVELRALAFRSRCLLRMMERKRCRASARG